MLLLVMGYLRWTAWVDGRAEQGNQLASRAAAVDELLRHQLHGTAAALRAIRDPAAAGRVVPDAAAWGRNLQLLASAMPGVHALVIIAPTGRVLVSSRAELLGQDASAWVDLDALQARHAPELVHLSAPAVPGRAPLAAGLATVWLDADGNVAGVVAALLAPNYFDTVLRAVLQTSDAWAAIAHDDGRLIVQVPPRGDVTGVRVDRPGAPFERHRASGQAATVYEGTLAWDGGHRLIAQRSVAAPAAGLDHGFVLAVTRDIDTLTSAWWRGTATQLVLLLILAGTGALALLVLHRWRAEGAAMQRKVSASAAAAAERLQLALDGADLALWELDVASGQGGVSPRWNEMLGLPPDSLACATVEGWLARVHPEDRQRAQTLQQAYLRGDSSTYEAVYRLRHESGRWVWVLDRGRIVERDTAGRPLKMVGTHMDITAWQEARESLQRSESDLATTLDSIADGVLATDAAGRVTRMNPAAERLTGWTVGEAVGRPMGDVLQLLASRTREPLPDPVRRVLVDQGLVGLANDTLVVARDGTECQIAHRAAPIMQHDGTVTGVVMVFRDVSESYRVQQALRDRERQLSAIADALPGPVSRVDRDGRYLFANAAYEHWFGLSREQIVGRTQREVLGEHYMLVETHVRRALAGELVVYETPVRTRQGPRHAMVTLVPERDDEGKVLGHFTIVGDISERKRAEDALRDSEARTRALLDTLSAGVVVHAPDTRIVDSNPAASEILGLSTAQMAGKAAIDPAWHFVEEDGSPMPLARYPVNQVLATGQRLSQFIVGIVRPDRTEVTWVLVEAEAVLDQQGAVGQVVVTFVDVGRRVMVEAHLRLLEAAVSRLNDIVLITEAPADASPRIVYVNPAFERVTGHSAVDAMGRSPKFLQGPDTDPAEAARVATAVRSHRPVHAELLNYARDGRSYWVEIDIVPLVDKTGRVTHMVAVQRDITERREARDRLLAAQDELAATLAAIPDLLFEIRLDGEMLHVHASRPELLVMPTDAQKGRRIDELLPPDAAAETRAALQDAHRDGVSSGRQYALDLPVGRRHFELSVAPRPVSPGAVPRFVVMARDVTDRVQAEADRRALEAQLRESQRLETIGALAGGIAHDFNNLVAGILGNASLARHELPPGHPALASLGQIERAGQRARSMVRRILDQSRRTPARLADLDLRAVVEEPLELLRSTLPPGVRLESGFADPMLIVHGDATQLQQVVMNLCVNAVQALPSTGGLVTVRLTADDDVARLEVNDDGCGMDADTLAHAFAPLFTTKREGTGLGLAVVKGIVEGHGGQVVVSSEPGRGTTVRVSLPRATSASLVPDGTDRPGDMAVIGHGQRVLYVDDDEIMRDVVQRLLERAGWQVCTASGGAEALNLLDRPGHDVKAIVSDLTMPPGMSGLELCQEIAHRHPGMPTLICSGHRTDELLAKAASVGIRRVLAKEDMLDELVPAVALLMN
ncbi:MAG: PAS domain S-box protein [Burkholderiaceae bacterium]|nr:PAS domain S-box protein [Burkholderiaceae bacterium]